MSCHRLSVGDRQRIGMAIRTGDDPLPAVLPMDPEELAYCQLVPPGGLSGSFSFRYDGLVIAA